VAGTGETQVGRWCGRPVREKGPYRIIIYDRSSYATVSGLVNQMI
jgi:hypothetical protein